MRSINSIKNIAVSILLQLVIILLGFMSRKVFLDSLGTEYLGVNGVLTNIIAILSLVEAGISGSLTYNLYKPLAENNREKIIALVQLYKQVYRVLAFIIFVVSLAIYPILDHLLKGSESVSFLKLAFFIFVLKNIVYYFYEHKVAIFVADQKEYILTRIYTIFHVIATLAKMLILILTKDFILFLIIELITNTLQCFINNRVVAKRYPYLFTKKRYQLEKQEKAGLITQIKALFLHKVGTYFIYGTDNMIISYFLGVGTVGLYANYLMLIGQVGALFTPILGGMTASVANVITIEGKDKQYSVFNMVYLINFWLYSIGIIFLYNLLEPFINWWLGDGYLLDHLTFIILLVNFYLTGMRACITTFKEGGGIFVLDKYTPIIEAGLNVGISMILVHYLGLAGIFLGTTISLLAVFWYPPRLVFKNIFGQKVSTYFWKYGFYSLLAVVTCVVTTLLIDHLFSGNSLLILVGKGLVCLFVPNLVYLLVFFKRPEFQYLKDIIGNILLSIKLKVAPSK
ncbi:lipopolysaccharide biosynthesis protein [Bacillus marasmi]|uniref:lipopolysaccharide biosynthesis protein n=1 Tax=Bacillus marasmi TaxID=1926279 RepID=UPI0011CB530D|nr:hypothetical protein [Bacillus marasmi]